MLKPTDLDSLPDDILIQILMRIPAEDILDATKFVCRKWFEITNTRDFIYTHLHHSTPGLLIQNDNSRNTTFMSTRGENQFQISKFSYHRYFWSSCDGLMLQTQVNDKLQLKITNPLTSQRFDLPPFTPTLQHASGKSAIARVATRMEYKVVRTYYLGDPRPACRIYCAILTVGVDESWRLVDTQHLSLSASMKLDWCSLVTDGFVHWVGDLRNDYILSLNVESEVITKIPVPRCEGEYYYYKYMSGGSYLSLLIGLGLLKWEVWEMKPADSDSDSGEYWKKLPDIDLEAHKALLNETYDKEASQFKPDEGDCLDCKLIPGGWLKYGQVIVFIAARPMRGGRFRQSRLRVVYNVKTQDVTLFGTDSFCYNTFHVHRNSLVRI